MRQPLGIQQRVEEYEFDKSSLPELKAWHII
jgi:hypothetical protein